MHTLTRHRPLSALTLLLYAGLTAAILSVLLPEQAAAQPILHTDQSLRSTMSTRLRAEGATHQLVPGVVWASPAQSSGLAARERFRAR
jgi:hypothetical protein